MPASNTLTDYDPNLQLIWLTYDELRSRLHDRNWRLHPQDQQDSVAAGQANVGWADVAVLNRTTGNMLDGHGRVEDERIPGTEKCPVLLGTWSEAQEKTILASLDSIGVLATANEKQFKKLLENIKYEGLPELETALETSANLYDIEFATPDEVTTETDSADDQTLAEPADIPPIPHAEKPSTARITLFLTDADREDLRDRLTFLKSHHETDSNYVAIKKALQSAMGDDQETSGT